MSECLVAKEFTKALFFLLETAKSVCFSNVSVLNYLLFLQLNYSHFKYIIDLAEFIAILAFFSQKLNSKVNLDLIIDNYS